MAAAAHSASQAHGAASSGQPEPLPRVCAVHVPGRVKNVDEAVLSIGGSQVVHRAMTNRDGRLRFRLCRRYKFQAPLVMTRRKTANLLLKATRQSDGSWDAQAVGLVDLSFAPEGLADFIFVPGKVLSYGEKPVLGSIEQELQMGRPGGSPYMPPAYFTSVTAPQNYNFENNALLRKHRRMGVTAVVGTQEKRLKRHWVNVQQVKFRDQGPVPDKPPEGIEESLNNADFEILKAVKGLFEERPIWLRQPMEERLGQVGLRSNVNQMQRVLMMTSFLNSDGPWRQSYSRLGYDPRADPAGSRLLQIIDFRDKGLREVKAYFERAQGSGGVGVVTEVDCHFRRPPVNKSQLYQFIDIEDEEIQRLLSSTEPTAQCTERWGWLTLATIDAIRQRMAVKAELIRRSRAMQAAIEGPATLPALLPPPTAPPVKRKQSEDEEPHEEAGEAPRQQKVKRKAGPEPKVKRRAAPKRARPRPG